MIRVSVDVSSGTPVYVQIMDQVHALVREGALQAGASLPSVRQLAADLEVNPNTIAKAYTLLEREGTVRTIARRGTFVAEGAPGSSTRATDRRLDEAITRVIERAEYLNLGSEEVLAALQRRLARRPSARSLQSEAP